jgi:uncharacterized caspase-like protein
MRAFALLLAICLATATNAPCLADGRVALVIGNSTYQHVPSLPNPANDAQAIALLLKGAGFDSIETHENLGVSEMRRVVREFSDRTRDADIAMVYYAGHGMEAGGINYLVPIDATLRRDIDVEDETVSLDRLLQVMEPARRLRLVILDACRDNPFVKSMARTMASRSVGRGLARVEPAMSDTLIAFAAKAGSTAADGDRLHSPFTSALLKYLVTPGLDIRLALGQVRDEVMNQTSKKQEPFVYGSLGGAIITLASLSGQERIELPSVDADSAAARDYEATAKVATKAAWKSFLAKHSTGLYADLARAQLAKLDSAPATALPSGERANPDSAPAAAPPKGKAKIGSNGSAFSMSCCLSWYRRHPEKLGGGTPQMACQWQAQHPENSRNLNFCTD